jgi:hypothetical protein
MMAKIADKASAWSIGRKGGYRFFAYFDVLLFGIDQFLCVPVFPVERTPI